ncbi:hypothetical protein [Clostridium vincentii]|uniref:Uncharacterized protein n=1 Tax=Clostridium vincentii TaxID=52704 RepID=A0A2T0B492_9CLOT|nr:hypothetical protein [Clostridium vincentii]PRR78704.1 hypothetical protein CLVI_34420 [Clostridium vincentii]
MKKIGFLKKSNVIMEPPQYINELTNSIEDELDINKELTIMDRDITKYIIKNFPSMSIEIKNSLNNLSSTLEKTIDFIEDKSTDVVKIDRAFELSQAHRNISISVYGIVKEINTYIKWMEEESLITEELKDDENKNNIKSEEITSEYGESKEIYENFSKKEPIAFKLEEYFVKVNGWNDLIIKTADLLVKNFKKSKDNLKVVYQDMKIFEEISTENELRDTVIDILNEYNIYLKNFVVFIK